MEHIAMRTNPVLKHLVFYQNNGFQTLNGYTMLGKFFNFWMTGTLQSSSEDSRIFAQPGVQQLKLTYQRYPYSSVKTSGNLARGF
jgi:predicted phosphohydrolase